MVGQASSVPGEKDSEFAEVQSIMDRLDQAEEIQKVKVTASEVKKVLYMGGKKGAELVQELIESAEPVPEPVFSDMETQQTMEPEEEYGYRHNTLTGETEKVAYAGEPAERPYLTQEDVAGFTPSPMPRSFPGNWYEVNPARYLDTRSTCKLLIFTDKGTGSGSGFLIEQDRIATAAHCVYNSEHADDNWVDSIMIIPACMSTSPYQPYGIAESTSITVPTNWANNQSDFQNDYAVVHLDTWFSFSLLEKLVPGNAINGWWVRAQGYPYSSDNMYLIGGNITSNTNQELVINNEQFKGSSGGPVLDERKYVIGIISRGGGGETHAVKFTSQIVNNLMTW